MIYATFTLWLFLILFTAAGVYRLWSRIVKPVYLNWALLPGTVVSEMAYIFGCLITGGEVRRAKIMPTACDGTKGSRADTSTETSGGLKVLGPIVASLLTIVACAAAIIVLRKLLGAPVIDKFVGFFSRAELPKQLPASSDEFWSQVEGQVHLLRRMGRTWLGLDWLNWRVPLFVYLAACLTIRMGPANRAMRPMLAAAVMIAALIGLVGVLSSDFRNLISDVWPLLTYIWASLLLLLVLTLLLSGVIRLGQILFDKDK